jgi:GxxExxY protein
VEPSLETPENRVGSEVVASSLKVHSALGPGLLEGAYEACLAHELSKRALRARKQVSLPLRYEDLLLQDAYRIDLLIDDLVVVEIKSVETILPVHRAQLVSYLKLGGYKLGYLLNFNVAHMRNGIKAANGL